MSAIGARLLIGGFLIGGFGTWNRRVSSTLSRWTYIVCLSPFSGWIGVSLSAGFHIKLRSLVWVLVSKSTGFYLLLSWLLTCHLHYIYILHDYTPWMQYSRWIAVHNQRLSHKLPIAGLSIHNNPAIYIYIYIYMNPAIHRGIIIVGFFTKYRLHIWLSNS